MRYSITKTIDEHLDTIQKTKRQSLSNITKSAKEIASAISRGNKVLVCGNGGSASDAQHIAAELVNRFKREREPYSAIALTTDTSILTSISNDYGYEFVFSKQIEALGKPGDVLIVITTSDSIKNHSKNLLNAILEAKKRKIKIIGLFSSKSENLSRLTDIKIQIPSKNTQRTQEAHVLVYHIICELVELYLDR